MQTQSLRAVAALIAAAGLGLSASLALRLSSELFASGPLASAAAAAVAATVWWAPPARGRSGWAFVTLSAVLFFGFGPVARVFVWLGGYGALPALAALYGIALVVSLAAPARAAAARAGRAGVAIAAGVLAISPLVSTEALFVGATAGAVIALLARSGESAPAGAAAPGRLGARTATFAITTVLLLGAFGAWALGRAALDPTPLGFVALLAGGVLAGALRPAGAAARGIAALAGFVGVGAAAWFGVERLADVIDRGPYAGAALFALLGGGAGLLLSAARPAPRALPAALGLTALALVPVLDAFPDAWVARAALAETTVLTNRARVEAARARAPLVAAHLGGAGSTALRASGQRIVAELDGSVADPDTRAGAAERFAGTLAACATAERTRARIGGDDLGLAVAALRAQGFLAVDTAVPDGAFLRAQSDARPDLARTWLHPSVRLVALPAPAVLRAGPGADAVVEIVRAPWTDGRRTFPRARDIALTRATLSPTGAHVLAVAATGLPDGALLSTIADFRAVYPDASLWLPPEGADTALLLGTRDGEPLPWDGIERCVASDEAGLRAVAIRTPLDLAALALGDRDALAALPGGRAGVRGLPETLHAAPALSLAALPALTAAPDRIFAGAPAALAERAESRRLFLELLDEASGGDVQDAIARARALGAAPGGARALEPVLKPNLDRARQAMARGAREGIGSKAWEEAEAALGTARALAPDHAATRCLEGELAGARGQLARAEEAFQACAAADPELLAGHDGLARARRSRGNLTGAEEALRGALRARPDAWTTAHNLGVFLLELGRFDEAERLLKQAVAAQARDAEGLAPAPYLALARLYLATGRAELALAQAERASGLAPDADALALRGAARFELRQPDIAEEDFRAALAVDPRHVLALGGIGQLQATRGEYELAAASFRAVLEADPQNAPARENLARLARLVAQADE